MVFWLNAQVFEYRVRPEALHMIPVLNLTVANGVVNSVSYTRISLTSSRHVDYSVPGPFAAAKASSPMKKSRSSVPLFIDKFPPPDPVPPVRNEGFAPTPGRPDPVPPPPGAPPLVAMAVGNTKDGESFPANPREKWSVTSQFWAFIPSHRASRNLCRCIKCQHVLQCHSRRSIGGGVG